MDMSKSLEKEYNLLLKEKQKEVCISNVIKVANYIINYSIDIGKPVNILKLQKLLFYVQAYGLVNRVDLLQCNFSLGRYGPLSYEVYELYRVCGNFEISCRVESFTLSCREKELIERVVDSYTGYSGLDMVLKVCNEEICKVSIENGEGVLSSDCIKRFYIENKSIILGKLEIK